ncbi:MAG: hypothetical protein Kow0077_04550 [Anaerolineae bacterium]
MNWEAFLGLLLVLAAMLMLIQRTEPKRRRAIFIVMLLGGELVRRFVAYRGWHTEGAWALIVALALNALFWVFVGRSNPPRSSEDEIEVIGNE